MLKKIYLGFAMAGMGATLTSTLLVIGKWPYALIGVAIVVLSILYLNSLLRQIKRNGLDP